MRRVGRVADVGLAGRGARLRDGHKTRNRVLEDQFTACQVLTRLYRPRRKGFGVTVEHDAVHKAIMAVAGLEEASGALAKAVVVVEVSIERFDPAVGNGAGGVLIPLLRYDDRIRRVVDPAKNKPFRRAAG